VWYGVTFAVAAIGLTYVSRNTEVTGRAPGWETGVPWALGNDPQSVLAEVDQSAIMHNSQDDFLKEFKDCWQAFRRLEEGTATREDRILVEKAWQFERDRAEVMQEHVTELVISLYDAGASTLPDHLDEKEWERKRDELLRDVKDLDDFLGALAEKATPSRVRDTFKAVMLQRVLLDFIVEYDKEAVRGGNDGEESVRLAAARSGVHLTPAGAEGDAAAARLKAQCEGILRIPMTPDGFAQFLVRYPIQMKTRGLPVPIELWDYLELVTEFAEEDNETVNGPNANQAFFFL
jgi:hypothetical protein